MAMLEIDGKKLVVDTIQLHRVAGDMISLVAFKGDKVVLHIEFRSTIEVGDAGRTAHAKLERKSAASI